MKRPPVGRSDIRAACDRLALRGKFVSLRSVRGELLRSRDVGASLSSLVTIVREWKAEQIDRASGRIEAAVDAILALRSRHERQEVRRLCQQRSGGGVVVGFRRGAASTGKGSGAKR